MHENHLTADFHSLCIYLYTKHSWAPLIFSVCKGIILGTVCITSCYRAKSGEQCWVCCDLL